MQETRVVPAYVGSTGLQKVFFGCTLKFLKPSSSVWSAHLPPGVKLQQDAPLLLAGKLGLGVRLCQFSECHKTDSISTSLIVSQVVYSRDLQISSKELALVWVLPGV